MATEQRLPASIRAQVEQADALAAQLDAVTAGTVAAPAPNPIDTLLNTPPAPAPAPTPTPAPAPATAPTPAPAPTPPAPAPTTVAATPAPISRQELDALMQTQTQVREFLARQTAAPTPPAPPVPAPLTVDRIPKDNDRDVEIFGKDVLDMVDRKIEQFAEILRVQLQRIDQRFKALGSTVESTVSTVQTTAEDTMVMRLDAAVPNWRAINVEPGFLKWLSEIDPVFGQQRQVALNTAAAAKNAESIIAIFKAYESTKTPVAAPTQPNNNLASLVAPDTVASEAPAPAPEAPIFTAAQVQSFYRDLAQNKYAGREADAKRIVDAIDLAAAQGRITR